jgi:holo-[acyl-carrier protein] synthase
LEGITIGMDIVEIKRFRQKPLKSNISFYNSIFTKRELAYCLKYSDPYPHLAGTFAAKEAVIKCYHRPIKMIDISVIREIDEKPVAIFRYRKKVIEINISISHTESIAVAVAILILY